MWVLTLSRRGILVILVLNPLDTTINVVTFLSIFISVLQPNDLRSRFKSSTTLHCATRLERVKDIDYIVKYKVNSFHCSNVIYRSGRSMPKFAWFSYIYQLFMVQFDRWSRLGIVPKYINRGFREARCNLSFSYFSFIWLLLIF